MKILHLNTFPWGGAFNGAYRLHLALLSAGVDSKMLVNYEPQNSDLQNVFVYNTPFHKTSIFNRICTKFGKPITSDQKRYYLTANYPKDYQLVNFPFSDFDITCSSHFKEADIIHIHWIGNFLDYKTFFSKVKKPIVWTLRDLAPVQGIFHYELDKIKNQYIMGDLESKFLSYKSQALAKAKVPLHVVGLSNWITNKSIESKIFKKYPHSVIPNCIDTKSYQLVNKDFAKDELNIAKDKIVLAFASHDVANLYKGVDLVVDAVSKLAFTKEIEILTFGNGIPPVFPMHVVHRHFGTLQHNSINKIFSAADALLFPTKEESLGNVMLEAMACGTPVIGTKIGGLLDVIRPGFNGLFAKDVSSDGIKDAIIEFINTKDQFNSNNIRNFIEENFSERLIAERYIELYVSISQSKQDLT